ncbi:hypothetical protein SLS64_013585 [Diaporthe eres]|uniref:2'-5' RNA ligase superfamily-domain-containing protein n=1 Tax=Diaporthe eres TaxID=83184 RepID=A0ABR1NNB4_DIAER
MTPLAHTPQDVFETVTSLARLRPSAHNVSFAKWLFVTIYKQWSGRNTHDDMRQLLDSGHIRAAMEALDMFFFGKALTITTPERNWSALREFHVEGNVFGEGQIGHAVRPGAPAHGLVAALRRSHFPRHLDRHPAHLTLFHALPGSEMPLITAALDELCAAQRPVRLATGSAFRMRRGVGINVADAGNGGGQRGGAGGGGGSQAARRLHGELQRRWWEVLSAQDRRPWRPHWTVQNKAADEGAVDAAMEDVRMGFRGAEGLATGCALWRYEKGGGWAFERGFDFEGDKPVSR